MIIDNAKNISSPGYEPGFNGDGFLAMAVLYGVYTVAVWFVPSLMAVFGSKLTMVVGSATYAAYTGSYLYLNDVFLYTTAALNGFGSAMIWIAQVNKG